MTIAKCFSQWPTNGRKRFQCPGRTVMAAKDYHPTKKSPASEATRAGQSPVGSGPVRTVDSATLAKVLGRSKSVRLGEASGSVEPGAD